MDCQVDRLRRMFEDADIWEDPEKNSKPFMIPQDAPEEAYVSSDSDCLEKVTSQIQTQRGQLPRAILHAGDENTEIPSYNLQIGELAIASEKFCHLESLLRFPYDFLGPAHRDRIIQLFFAKGQVYERTWDFFYLHPPSNISKRPVLLVPSTQVEFFFSDINSKMHVLLAMPDETAQAFHLKFSTHGTLRPRYLGRSTEREMAEGLKQAIPSVSYRPDNEPEVRDDLSQLSLDVYRKKLEFLFQGEKKKKAASKAKKKAERFVKQRSWHQSLKVVQRHLGIRGPQGTEIDRRGAVKNAVNDSSSGYHEAVKAAMANFPCPEKFTLDKSAQHPQEDSVVFICVDVEAFERNHNLITEIGIATLDTSNITSIPPGTNGTGWISAITAKHFRIKEYGHLENKEFLQGCADSFLFGTSQWISIKDAPREIAKCFKPPFSNHGAEFETSIYAASSNASVIDQQDNLMSPKRNLVLVGHDLGTDINYLKRLGYDVHNLSNLRELTDTSNLYRALRRQNNPTNLGSILVDLNLFGSRLHNAGNDAVYTLQAMVGIALRARLEHDHVSTEQEKKEKLTRSVEDPENAWDMQQGWSSDNEDNDDGVPMGHHLAHGNLPSSFNTETTKSSVNPSGNGKNISSTLW